MYDIVFLGSDTDTEYKRLKVKFPTLKRADSLERARKLAFTKFFWIVWNDIVVNDEFDFSYKVSEWDEEYIHVFKNGAHYNGVCLVPKKRKIADKEFKYRFFVNRKEIDVLASNPRLIESKFDITFISYQEPNADKNWNILRSRFPQAIRIENVKGIHQAHIEAAKLCSTEMFWVVDGDAVILDDFSFDYSDPEKFTVHVWRSRNPINDLEYGYGGVKLLPTQMTLDMDVTTPDMTTSISKKFVSVPKVSNITEFNTDPFNTWKSAFRECVKLSSKTIEGQINEETERRLKVWTTIGIDRQFGNFAIKGALAGTKFGHANKDDPNQLFFINDYDWLHEQYLKDNQCTE